MKGVVLVDGIIPQRGTPERSEHIASRGRAVRVLHLHVTTYEDDSRGQKYLAKVRVADIERCYEVVTILLHSS